jgi:aerobic-type carbon monoxide dehydrogenase small subunit (CoxS/CutS family)
MLQAHVLPTEPVSTIVPEKVREGIDIQINGESYRHTGDPQMPLLWYLRDVLRLTGTKYGSDLGENGADLVLVADAAVSAITVTMQALAGKSITTVEGLAARDGGLHPLQQAFIDENAPQCGYCYNGMLVKASELLANNPEPSEPEIREAMNGHLCRCGTYPRIMKAIKRAAVEMQK